MSTEAVGVPVGQPDASPLGLGSARPFVVLAAAVVILLLLIVASLGLGTIGLSPAEAVRALFVEREGLNRTIVWDIRLPRILVGIIVGGTLALAGTLLQEVTRNPLADPTLMGVTAASALAGVVTFTLYPDASQWTVTVTAIGGGLAGAGLLFFIAWRGAVSPVRLALSGVALSAFFGAGIVALLSSSQIFLQSSLGFVAGDLFGTGWREVRIMTPLTLPCAVLAVLLAGRLNALALGDEIAAGLGVLTDRTRLLVLALCGVLTGVAVSAAGVVSFVGLVCPHLARFTVGSDNRFVIPASALYGAVLVVAADLAARLVIRPSEIPMGIVTALVGAPFLLWLVRFRG